MSAEDQARRLFESFGIEASDGDLAALAEWEAAIRADERDRLKARLEAFVEPFEHARVDGWVPDSVLSELLGVVEEARGGE